MKQNYIPKYNYGASIWDFIIPITILVSGCASMAWYGYQTNKFQESHCPDPITKSLIECK